jgi:hypothetical protein
MSTTEPPAQQPQASGEAMIATTPAAVLDLNPTGFVDDLTNSVGGVVFK